MSGVNETKTLIEPKLEDAFDSLRTQIFRTMNCVKIGEIQLFDVTKKTAQIQILFKRVIPDSNSPTGQSIRDYPVLVDCPVFTLQGGGGAIQFPIAAGDQCVVLFADRNIDAWFQNGTAVAPFDARCHDLSDGIALVGLNSLASDLADYETDKVTIRYGDTVFKLTATGFVFEGTSLEIDADTFALVASGGAEVDLSGAIVTLKNNTTTLKTLINGLIDVIAAATVQTAGTPPLTAVTIAALNAYKLQIATLLG